MMISLVAAQDQSPTSEAFAKRGPDETAGSPFPEAPAEVAAQLGGPSAELVDGRSTAGSGGGAPARTLGDFASTLDDALCATLGANAFVTICLRYDYSGLHVRRAMIDNACQPSE